MLRFCSPKTRANCSVGLFGKWNSKRTILVLPGARPDDAALNALIAREYTGFTLPPMVKAEAR
jgi:hypothetical protein